MDSKLYRSRNVVISGVCGGIAEYFRIDPAIVRVVWVLVAIPETFLAVIAYIVCAIIIPQKPIEGYGYSSNNMTSEGNESNEYSNSSPIENDNRTTFNGTTVGIALVLIGAVIIFKQFFHWFNFNNLWPAILIIIGIYIIVKKK